MEKIEQTQTAVDRAYKKYKKEQRQHPPTREILHLDEELARHLPTEDRMFILNLIGRKTKLTPFDKTYYCRCGHKFHERDSHNPRSYKDYRREILCPYCYRCDFTEHKQERRPTRKVTHTTRDLIRQMLQQE